MNRKPKTTKNPKTKSNVQIRDLKPKKDAKGGVDENISFTFGSTKPTYQH